MTPEEYRLAYKDNFKMTLRFLITRGLFYDNAIEITQAAWCRGLKALQQLKDPASVLRWVNTIALNIHRDQCRRASFVPLERFAIPPPDTSGIDVYLLSKYVDKGEWALVREHYLEGRELVEIAETTGRTATAERIRLLRIRRKIREKMAQRIPVPLES
jgi:DNA-directed RNA polymerase specialized sigma24 family protein